MSHQHNFLAFDLGAESGRAMLGQFDGERIRLSEVHRFPNGPVRLPDGLHWDVLRLWTEIKHGIGKVGNDVFGDFIINLMGKKGLDTSGIGRSQTSPTSKTMIIPVVGQDRRFIHTFGANAELTYEDVDLDLVARGKVLYVGGYLGLPRLDQAALVNLLSFARAQGARTVLDVIVPSTAPYGVDDVLSRVLPYTDAFLPNDDEAALLTGKDDPKEQAAAFLARGCGTAVITMGERGVLAKTATQTVRAPAFKVSAVDPSGAGDAFDAGFIMGLLKGWELVKSVEFACALGASATMKLGCTPGVFTMAEARAFLAENQLAISSHSMSLS